MLLQILSERLCSGGPTLAVWPEVALAALGCVDEHGAVPAAPVPPQPVRLVCASVDPFLGITCGSAERGKTQEDECYVEVWVAFLF